MEHAKELGMRVFITAMIASLVLTTIGIFCIVAGVHGPSIIMYLGTFLLLPAVILSHFGIPIAIPGLHRVGVLSGISFMAIQLTYYYALLRLVTFVWRAKKDLH